MRGASLRRISRQQFVDQVRNSRRAQLRHEIESKAWKGITDNGKTVKNEEQNPEEKIVIVEPEITVVEKPVEKVKETKKKASSKNGKKGKPKK